MRPKKTKRPNLENAQMKTCVEKNFAEKPAAKSQIPEFSRKKSEQDWTGDIFLNKKFSMEI